MTHDITLDQAAVYITPLGRHCVWEPVQAGLLRHRQSYANFKYLKDGATLTEGLVLTPQNFKILRKAA